MTDRNHAIIVGGAGGIGSAMARRLAQDGYRVTLADIGEEAAQRLALELEGEGHEAVRIDVASDVSVDSTLDAIDLGAPARALVIASGGMVTKPGSTTVATMSTADWSRGIWRKGMFPFGRLITEFPFAQIGEAWEQFRAGKVIKPILRM